MGPAALLLTGGGLIAAGQIQEGRITEAQGKFAKKIALRNQQALARQAKAEQDAASVEEGRVARQEKIVKAAQRAQLGKTGGQIVGATLAALTDTAVQFSIQRNLVLRTGLVRGRELRERGQIELAKGRFARTLGKKAKQLSFIKAGGTILTSFGLAGQTPGPLTQQQQVPGTSGGFAPRSF